ncbi:MAG TPA: alpha-amylase family glycosyl hydrolase [Candidatus Paceibacterota bacterium]|nr:alpha-amylase family glycosyl hydrolase [Candidatus Paceibacterota bacterium]
MKTSSESAWYQDAIIYQIYPLSFKDSDGDGIGDLRGIINSLDHLAGKPDSLGVTGIWLCPFFPSPMKDHGYDISDYCGIDPRFGTMEDFEELVQEANTRGIKVLIDLVTNHTSSDHPWFKESRSSKNNPKRDWYIWKQPHEGGLPNNWTSVPGSSAWTLDKTTGEYYLHQFLPEQPDLNWRNPEVVKAMSEVIDFWTRKGVSGFRLDALSHIYEDPDFKDEPANPRYRASPGVIANASYEALLHVYSKDQPSLQEAVSLLSTKAHKANQFIVSETYLGPEGLKKLYDMSPYQNHAPFNFFLITERFNPSSMRSSIEKYESLLSPKNIRITVLGNHDQPRASNRLGQEFIRIAALFQLTLPGIPFIYYGEEIGMRNVDTSAGPHPYPELAKDGFTSESGGWNRDESRTPMQWNQESGVGFSTGTPWLPTPSLDSLNNITVSDQRTDPNSLLSLYKSLIALRRADSTLSLPHISFIDAQEGFLAYYRGEDNSHAVYLNFTNTAGTENLETIIGERKVSVTIQTDPGCTITDNALFLPAHSGVILKLS